MNTNLEIPSLTAGVVVAPSFAAFKVEERVSFVRSYDPKVQAIEGFRHAVIRYRNTDKKVAEKQAQMVTVPQIKLPEDVAIWADTDMAKQCAAFLVAYLEDEQDMMIRSFIDTGKSAIHWDELELVKVIESINAARVSNRLTKEQIEAWAKIAFVESCNQRADQISEAKSYNADQKQKQRAGTLNAYVELACKLAAPVPNIGQQSATALKNLLVVAKLDDDMAKVLLNKLDAILNPKIVENGDL